MAAASPTDEKSLTADEGDHYDHVAKSYESAYFYDKSNKEYQDFLTDSLQSSLACNPDHDVVDLGGGTGHFTEWFAARVGLDLKRTSCVDPSSAMIKLAGNIEGL